MSSAYNEAVKRVLADINKFLSVTLKSESLSKNGQKERGRVLEQLQDLFSKYDSLAPTHSDEGSASSANVKETSFDESRNTTGSEEDGYSDSVADTTVKALTDPAKIGYLEKKQKDLLFTSTWKKMYCVLHKNVFYYFKKPGDKKQQGAFYITGYTAQEAPQNVKDASKKDCSFELVCPGKRTYQFCADSASDFQAWKDAINSAEPIREEAGDDDDDDDGDLYEPLGDLANEGGPKISQPDKRASTATSVPEEEEDNDDLIYEPLDEQEEKKPISPKQPPHSAVPLPPIPGTHKEKDNKGGEEDRSPPPLPSRSVGDIVPPALPKRNVPPVPIPEIPEKRKRTPTLGKLVHPSEDFENMFYGVYNCKGSSANELNFVRGDIIHIINRELDVDDWWIGELAGKIGLVPKSYLHPAYQIEF